MSIESAARRYIAAQRRLPEADIGSLLEVRYEIDDAFHELCAELGESCPLCAIGDCPYSEPDMEPGDDAVVVTVEHDGRML